MFAGTITRIFADKTVLFATIAFDDGDVLVKQLDEAQAYIVAGAQRARKSRKKAVTTGSGGGAGAGGSGAAESIGGASVGGGRSGDLFHGLGRGGGGGGGDGGLSDDDDGYEPPADGAESDDCIITHVYTKEELDALRTEHAEILDAGDDAVPKLELQVARDQSIVDAAEEHMKTTKFLKFSRKKAAVVKITNVEAYNKGKEDSAQLQTSRALA